jgi:hypothetical protein
MRTLIRAWIVCGSIVCASVASAQPQGAAPDAQPASPAPSTFTLRRKLALTAGVISVAAVGAGIGRGLQATRREDDAYALCGSPYTPCPDAPAANHLVERAKSRALQANVAFGVAGVTAVAAAVLWFTGAPQRRFAVSPRVGSLTGVDLAMRF